MKTKIKHPLNFNEIINLYNENNKFGEFIGIKFEIIEKGLVEYKGKINENILATPIAAHGGFVASLCDGALGIAALTIVAESKRLVSTIEMNIKYLKPILLNDEITAIGKVLSYGKRIIYSSCEVYNQNGVLVAYSSGTFNAYPIEKSNFILKKTNY